MTKHIQVENFIKIFISLLVMLMSLMMCAYSTVYASTLAQGSREGVEKAVSAPYRNVIYYGDWSIWGGQDNYYPKNLPANLYTHLNYAFIAFDQNGNLKLTDSDAAFGADVGSGNGWNNALSGVIPAINALRAEYPNMKIGISLGGWSKSGNFSDVAADSAKRSNFVANVMKFIQLTGMDFVDVDWEYPTNVRQPDTVDNKNDEGTPHARPEDKENYILLMQDFRNALDKLGVKEGKTYELSTALPGTVKQLQSFIDVQKLFKTIDFANLMTYDMNGAWGDTSGHQTALYTNPKDPTGYSIKNTVDYLKHENVEMDKIVIGAAMYTRGWDAVEKGSDSQFPGLFQHAALTNKDADNTPSRGANNELPTVIGDGGRVGGVWSYRNIDKLKAQDPTLKEYWDDVAKAPYLYSTETKHFFTFDNVKSVKAKADFVKENHLGGMISWMASQDKDTDGNGVRKELGEAIKTELYGNSPIPNGTIQNKANINTNVQVELESLDSGAQGFAFTITNNQKPSSKNDALGLANAYFSTIKKATFVITMKDGKTFTGGDWKAGTVTSKDGKTYVDLSSVYDAKYISPGKIYKFKLVPSKEMNIDPNNVQKVELLQYYSPGVQLFSPETVYQSITQSKN